MDVTSYLDGAKALQKELVELRRHLHVSPELSFLEFNTSQHLASRLSALGYRVKSGIAKTGLSADFGSGKPVIAIRAEMDALPIQERNVVTYASKINGVMHGCGHDANMACVMAAAQLLADAPLAGTIRVIMQPAAEESRDENGKAGAVLMIEEGVLEGVDAIIALHVDSTITAGCVGIISTPITAAPTGFTVQIRAANECAETNAIALQAAFIQSLYGDCQWRDDKTSEESIHFTAVESANLRGGSLESVTLTGAITAFSKERRRAILEHIESCLAQIREKGGQCSADFEPEAARPNEMINRTLREAACALLEEERVLTVKRKTWTEDFSSFLSYAPGALMLLGVEIPSNRRSHHSPTFDVDESQLYVGAAVLAATARLLMVSLK